MIISVDHGNKAIKTPHFQFTSGIVVSETMPGFKNDCLAWNGKYYTLTEQRISYLRDKTEDLRFYALTLFAIAYAPAGSSVNVRCGESPCGWR